MRFEIFNKIKKNKKNVLKISTGVMIGQIISVIALPIIARLYGPEIIGLWAFLYSITRIVISFSDLGLTHSIMVEDKINISKTYKVIGTFNILISVISSFAVVIYYCLFENEMNLVFIFIFMSVLIFTTKQIQVCYTWLNRNEEYNILMKNPIINNGIYGIVAIMFGISGMKNYGYFIAHIIGQVITLIHMKRYLPKGIISLDKNEIKDVIMKNNRFVRYQMPANIISNFKNEVPIILINFFWGAEILGYYSITVKVLKIPSTFLANAIGKVFFQTVSNMKRNGEQIGKYVANNLRLANRIGAIPMVLLISFSDISVSIFLGKQWSIAGEFIQVLALQFFFMFIINTIQGLSTVLEKQNYAMVSSLLQVVGFLASAVLGKCLFDDIYITLILMTISYIFIHVGYVRMLLEQIDESQNTYVGITIKYIVIILLGSYLLRSGANMIIK